MLRVQDNSQHYKSYQFLGMNNPALIRMIFPDFTNVKNAEMKFPGVMM